MDVPPHPRKTKEEMSVDWTRKEIEEKSSNNIRDKD